MGNNIAYGAAWDLCYFFLELVGQAFILFGGEVFFVYVVEHKPYVDAVLEEASVDSKS